MADKKIIAKELSSMCVTYNRRIEGEEAVVLIDAWAEAFEGVNDAELTTACKAARKRCKYFPTPAEVISIVDELRCTPKASPLAISESSPPEMRWRNKIMLMVCTACWKKQCSKADKDRAIDRDRPWEEREALARKILGAEFQEFADFLARLSPHGKAEGW